MLPFRGTTFPVVGLLSWDTYVERNVFPYGRMFARGFCVSGRERWCRLSATRLAEVWCVAWCEMACLFRLLCCACACACVAVVVGVVVVLCCLVLCCAMLFLECLEAPRGWRSAILVFWLRAFRPTTVQVDWISYIYYIYIFFLALLRSPLASDIFEPFRESNRSHYPSARTLSLEHPSSSKNMLCTLVLRLFGLKLFPSFETSENRSESPTSDRKSPRR